MPTNPVIESLLNHRSIRKFKPDPIEPDVLETILHCGTRAATASNLQYYSFVVVDDPAKKKAIGFPDVPVAIFAMVDVYRIKRWLELNNTVPLKMSGANALFTGLWDSLIALQNVVVAAESIGLGTCYYGVGIRMDVRRHLGVPEYVFPAGLVCIGYPEEDPGLSSRLPLDAVVHKNGYRIPSEDDIRRWYAEREKVWDTVSEEKKAKLADQGIHSIPQAVAAQKFSEQAMKDRSVGIIENLKRAGFVLG